MLRTIEKKTVVDPIKIQLIKLTSTFCEDRLDSEYSELCKKMIEKMARKRFVPFLSGKVEIWAASIIYAIGGINFLFDKSFQPYATPDDIATYFKVLKSTIGQKAKKIRDMFQLAHWDSEFATQKMLNSNPFSNLGITEDGFIVSLR